MILSKNEYEIIIEEGGFQNKMRFKLYTPEDLPIRFFGEIPRIANPEFFPEHFYICEGQNDVYFKLEQFGKMTYIHWEKLVKAEDTDSWKWVKLEETKIEDPLGIENDSLILDVIYEQLPLSTQYKAVVITAACPNLEIKATLDIPEVLRRLPAPVIQSSGCRYEDDVFELTVVWEQEKYTEYKDLDMIYVWYRWTADQSWDEYITQVNDHKLNVTEQGVYMVKIVPQYGCDSDLSEPCVVSLPVLY